MIPSPASAPSAWQPIVLSEEAVHAHTYVSFDCSSFAICSPLALEARNGNGQIETGLARAVPIHPISIQPLLWCPLIESNRIEAARGTGHRKRKRGQTKRETQATQAYPVQFLAHRGWRQGGWVALVQGLTAIASHTRRVVASGLADNGPSDAREQVKGTKDEPCC